MSADVASAASMGIGTALPPAPDPALLDDLVAANRILCDHGILDAYGHISAGGMLREIQYCSRCCGSRALICP